MTIGGFVFTIIAADLYRGVRGAAKYTMSKACFDWTTTRLIRMFFNLFFFSPTTVEFACVRVQSTLILRDVKDASVEWTLQCLNDWFTWSRGRRSNFPGPFCVTGAFDDFNDQRLMTSGRVYPTAASRSYSCSQLQPTENSTAGERDDGVQYSYNIGGQRRSSMLLRMSMPFQTWALHCFYLRCLFLWWSNWKPVRLPYN